MDTSFYSPLTEEGIKKSIKLIDILKDEEIDIIYSSPFIRTIQTIFPYSKKYNYKINLDYSLSEMQNNKLILENSYKMKLPNYLMKKYNCSNHKTIVEPEDYNYPEEINDLEKRVKKFLHYIISNHSNFKDKNIAIVTHMAVCNVINMIAYNNYTKSNEYTMETKYPKGALTRIFSNGSWDFKPINWKI
jgi:2,3-bisphosphoglycerate-dependent phosphoglycerate mutase